MSKDVIRMGLLGCGAAGAIQARAITDCSATSLAMVADIDPRSAQLVGDKFSVSHTTNMAELLACPEVDAVSIALPHHLHLEVGLLALEHGKPAIVEKPFTNSVENGERLLDAFANAGVALSAWVERRYCPFVEPARKFLQEGHAGRIIYVKVDVMGYKPRAYWEYGMRFESAPSDWRKSRDLSGGGPLLMNGIHQLDLVRHVTGLEVTEVVARMNTHCHEVEVEDTISVLLEFDNGAQGVIDCSCATFGAGAFPIALKKDRIYGTDGNLTLGSPLETFDRVWHHRSHDVPKYTVTEMKREAIFDFAEALREGRSPGQLAAELLTSHRVVTAAYESARTTLPVRLKPVTK